MPRHLRTSQTWRHPALVFFYGFSGFIAIGTFLLSLPVASAAGQRTPVLDAFITSTSAVFRIVQDVADDVTHAVQTDFTDQEASDSARVGKLRNRNSNRVHQARIEHTDNTAAATAGRVRIVAKAANELHGWILQQLGVSRVVYPEHEMGLRVAHSFAAPGVLDSLEAVAGYGIARILVPEPLAGRPPGSSQLQESFGVTVLAFWAARLTRSVGAEGPPG